MFVHLRVHSLYSLLQGMLSIKQMIMLSKEYNMPAIGLADVSNLYGALEFAECASANGVQPIIGYDINVQYNNDIVGTLLLLVTNEAAFSKVLVLNKLAMMRATADSPYITIAELSQHGKECIVLTGGMGGLLNEGWNFRFDLVKDLKKIFGDRLYIELQRHNEDNDALNHLKVELAQSLKIDVVATNDVFFPYESCHEAHDILRCISEGEYISKSNRSLSSKEHYFKTQEEMAELFKDLPHAIENTVNIAKRCHFFPQSSKPMLPNFLNTNESEGYNNKRDSSNDNNLVEAELLRSEALKGLRKRLNIVEDEPITEEYKNYSDRLQYELDVIIKMKYAGYFLIVSDFIKWSKNSKISVGPGRGSGAGSLVAWVLEITDLDPLRFGLIFERFLNPERVSMPDFDIDFCQEKRDLVIKYVQDKYGYENVAQIITFGKLQARAVIRDVGRVLQMPYGKVDRICKMIPNNPAKPVTLSEAIEINTLLQEEMNNDDNVNKLLQISLQLEGMYRHTSTHAAGIVIGSSPISELVPILYDSKTDMLVTQYSMKYCEAAGLVKFDFLGLKTLTVIDRAVELIQKQVPKFCISDIVLDDKKTFQKLSTGNSIGVFQLESVGMRDALKSLKPDNIDDIIALISLYRPGPMENIPKYVACKHGKDEVDVLHPLLIDILKDTFGVIIYQEQVMKIAQVLSGYSLGAADLLRRAMGKKIKSEMDKQRNVFVCGAIDNGVEKKDAEDIFELVAKFAGYGFNKSHAAAYGIISYQTAYLRAHYPMQFFTASLNLEIHNLEKINILFFEMRKEGLVLLAPDVNYSEDTFSILGDKIIYGLSAIKNFSNNAAKNIMDERKKNGLYSNIWNFLERLDNTVVNKKSMESLIKSSALDCLHEDRQSLLQSMPILIRYSESYNQDKKSGQISLFGENQEVSNTMPEIDYNYSAWSFYEKVITEFNAFGFYFLNHPLDEFYVFLNSKKIPQLSELFHYKHNNVLLAAVITAIKMRSSVKGRFAMVRISDVTASEEMTIFNSEVLDNCEHLLEIGQRVIIDAKLVRDENFNVRILVNDIQSLTSLESTFQYGIKIVLNKPLHNDVAIISSLLKKPSEASVQILLQVTTDNCKCLIEINKRVLITPKIISQLKELSSIEEVNIIKTVLEKH